MMTMMRTRHVWGVLFIFPLLWVAGRAEAVMLFGGGAGENSSVIVRDVFPQGRYEHGISTSKAIYQLGEPVVITHWLENISEEPLGLNTTQGPYFEVNILLDGQLVWHQYNAYFQRITLISFEPGIRMEDIIEWPMIDRRDEQFVDPGIYEVRAVFHGSADRPPPLFITIVPEPASCVVFSIALAIARKRARTHTLASQSSVAA